MSADDPRKDFPAPEWKPENSVTIAFVDEIITRAWDKVPQEKPWTLGILLPKAQNLATEVEEDGGDPRVVDCIRQLMSHIERLEGVRKYFEDLLLETPSETEKGRSEG